MNRKAMEKLLAQGLPKVERPIALVVEPKGPVPGEIIVIPPVASPTPEQIFRVMAHKLGLDRR
jgi:hypothetical protein